MLHRVDRRQSQMCRGDSLEVGNIVGLFNYLARLADGFGLKLDLETENAGRERKALLRPQ